MADLRREVGRWSLENAASLVYDRRMGWEEEWGSMMVDCNAAIFRLSGDLKLSLPLYKYFPALSPKWKELIKSEDRLEWIRWQDVKHYPSDSTPLPSN